VYPGCPSPSPSSSPPSLCPSTFVRSRTSGNHCWRRGQRGCDPKVQPGVPLRFPFPLSPHLSVRSGTSGTTAGGAAARLWRTATPPQGPVYPGSTLRAPVAPSWCLAQGLGRESCQGRRERGERED